MARFLFTVWPFPGHLSPHVAVANALRARGHDVAFYTGRRATEMLVGLGIQHFPMCRIDEEPLYVKYRFFQNDEGVGRVTSPKEWGWMREALEGFSINTIPDQVADIEPILDEWQPDAIVCDPTMWGPFLVLHDLRHIPVTIIGHSMGCVLSGPDAPMWGRGLPPPTTWRRRLRNNAERNVAKLLTRRARQTASAVRARYGLPPLTMWMTDYGGTMPLYLVASVRELDYNRRDLPPTVYYVGTLAWDRPSTTPPPAWIDELPTDKPLVYVTEGTLHGSQPRLLQAAAHGLAGLPIQVLMTFNADRDAAAAGLASLAPNIRLERYTPGHGWQSDILPRSGIVITNGGAGSVRAALSCGVPLIIVPTAWDKPENAQRIVEAGAGLRIAPRRCTPERLRAAVQQVLNDPSFSANARRLAEAFRFDGAARAADLLTNLASGVASAAALEHGAVRPPSMLDSLAQTGSSGKG